MGNILVKDNTKDPFTGKYMLQTYELFNVGVLLVRFIQLYSLKQNNPAKYDINFADTHIDSLIANNDFISIAMVDLERNMIKIDDLPQEVELHPGISKIILKWPLKNREDKLYRLTLNEDTGLVTSHFRDGESDVIKSSDGSMKYLKIAGYFRNYIKHRPQEEGPAIITAKGDHEYWENGEHIRTENAGQYIKG